MPHSRPFVVGAVAATLFPAAAVADTATFGPTGGEQSFVVPPGVKQAFVVATGGAGGGPLTGLTGGRALIATGAVSVAKGQVLYVEVGGSGGLPAGGFNGGGDGGSRNGLSAWGGGGATDLRLVSRALSGSLDSRVVVSPGGGGSASPAARGGDAAGPGGSSPGSFGAGGQPGSSFAGGAGGCTPLQIGCGRFGGLGFGGAGGSSGDGAQTRQGGGGGGGRYGGGGGAGVLDGSVGGGGGGSPLIADGGTLAFASLTEPPSLVITWARGNAPLDQACMGKQVSQLAQTFGGIASAARAFGVSVREGGEFLLASCGIGSPGGAAPRGRSRRSASP